MRSMTSFVEIFWIFAPKPSYTRIQSLFLIFKLVSKSPFLSSDVRVVLRPSLMFLWIDIKTCLTSQFLEINKNATQNNLKITK